MLAVVHEDVASAKVDNQQSTQDLLGLTTLGEDNCGAFL